MAWIRVSGPGSADIVQRLCGRQPADRRAVHVRLQDAAGPFDEGIVLWLPGPHTYTGEDMAEVSCHGNPVIVRRLVSACTDAGARLAEPGEFTRRAFLHGRLDLTRAEAVLQAIEARTPRGAALAIRGLSGEVADWIEAVRRRILDLGAEIEASLDFPEEATPGSVGEALAALAREIRATAETTRTGQASVHGARVGLVGPVNAGKSSLFNALLGRTRALVDPAPGTTRDVLEATLDVAGVEVTLLDTAGQGRAGSPLEARGQALRDEALEDADLLVVVLPAHRLDRPEVAASLAHSEGRPRILVGNHADRAGARFSLSGLDLLPTCALDGRGIDALKAALQDALVGEDPAGPWLASARQQALLSAVARNLEAALAAWNGDAGPAVAAEEVLEALDHLGAVDGRNVREDVLDTLFARFCIGK
ncbi:MAG: tRNA uridine-5-carboxymethylaminomethyl(34) synthesis GTPase MnmE [Deltaproteobacteria bacterium]|nr:tRNA uridine-5-carboxymethylaminomethyl(34) synthesis GTPase MnmE [Deltaproteobacteria bacterium]